MSAMAAAARAVVRRSRASRIGPSGTSPSDVRFLAAKRSANGHFLLKWLSLAYLLESMMIAYIPAESIGHLLGGDGIFPIVLSALDRRPGLPQLLCRATAGCRSHGARHERGCGHGIHGRRRHQLDPGYDRGVRPGQAPGLRCLHRDWALPGRCCRVSCSGSTPA